MKCQEVVASKTMRYHFKANMIILITLGLICFVWYAVWIIDFMVDKFSSKPFALLASLTAIMLPTAIIAQILIYMEIVK